MSTQRPWWSSKQTAEELGITEGALRVWRTKGKGPRWYKLCGRVRYAPGDVMRWIAEQEVTS